MVDSVPRWRLSLSWPIQLGHLWIADQMIPPLGREHSHGKDPVHSWKAGPGEVMNVENFIKCSDDMPLLMFVHKTFVHNL